MRLWFSSYQVCPEPCCAALCCFVCPVLCAPQQLQIADLKDQVQTAQYASARSAAEQSDQLERMLQSIMEQQQQQQRDMKEQHNMLQAQNQQLQQQLQQQQQAFMLQVGHGSLAHGVCLCASDQVLAASCSESCARLHSELSVPFNAAPHVCSACAAPLEVGML